MRDGPTAAASRLLADVAADPWGSMSASPYETGRLVALAPWLAGHAARLEFLRATQQPDGSWGGSDGYAAVPTLSVTAALLTERARPDHAPSQALDQAARAGLQAVRRWLDASRGPAIPDTVAAELMVPVMLAELDSLLPPSAGGPLRHRIDRQRLDALRAGLTAGHHPPEQVHHCLELLGPAAVAAPFVRPAMARAGEVGGGIGASAAATAAWLGGPAGPPASRAFLDRLQDRGGGPVPNVTPISYFEAAWVLNSLAAGGLAYQAPAELLDRLETSLTAAGCPAGPGLPVDVDDSAGVLAALLRHGRVRSPEPLLGFQTDGYFRCFHGERNPSVSANAHVLEALCLYLRRRPEDRGRFAAPAAMVVAWLLDQQQPDGGWWDKWHASPYYATACCALALSLHGGAGAHAAIERAVSWVLDTQRSDGTWGRWHGTVEETSYAMQVLALAEHRPAAAAALARGHAFLADPPAAEYPPLWHGKDLYTPVAVVRAARLAALHLSASARRGDVT
jgi:hypothetical protein